MTEDRTIPSMESLESLVGRVADEFLARQERGEQPNIEEYTARYPHAAELIRGALAALRVAGSHARDLAGTADSPLPEALGDFRIVREIGRGGMGIVYEAEQLSLRRRVALKVLPFAAVMDSRHLQRFRNEAWAAAGLDHPHVVRVYAVGSDRGVHYIAMQYIDGRSLADAIRERRGETAGNTASPPSDGDQTRSRAPDIAAETPATTAPPLAAGTTPRTPTDAAYARRVAEWGIQAAEALEHAHSLGIVHRDVKPANLLVDERGELFVADFGLAKLGPDPSVTGTGELLGTPRYMSPEQASARHGLVDHRSDVYSLGASLYEVLTLEPAFAGRDRATILRRIAEEDPTPPRKLVPRIPRDLETVLLKCLDKDPARRYPSAKDMADDLGRFLADKPVQAKRQTLRERVGRWAGRHPWRVAAAALITLIVLGGLAAWDRQRTLADAAAGQAADGAESLCRQGRYIEALAVARQAVNTLPRFGDNSTREREYSD